MSTSVGTKTSQADEAWARRLLRTQYVAVREDGSPGTGRYPIFRRGSGKPVILLHELPGVTPALVALSEELVAARFTVYLPALYGSPGARPTVWRQLAATAHVCLSAEFIKLRTGRRSPVTTWLRTVAKSIGKSEGRVGVIGLCLTGGFALALALEPVVAAAVVGQPSLPLPIGRARSRDCGLTRTELDVIAAREDVRFFGIRYSADFMSPCARFNRLGDLLGESFTRVELDSGPCNPNGTSRWAHGTLTNELLLAGDKDDPRRIELHDVRDRVIAFLKEHLTS